MLAFDSSLARVRAAAQLPLSGRLASSLRKLSVANNTHSPVRSGVSIKDACASCAARLSLGFSLPLSPDLPPQETSARSANGATSRQNTLRLVESIASRLAEWSGLGRGRMSVRDVPCYSCCDERHHGRQSRWQHPGPARLHAQRYRDAARCG